jgi:hypothetical protein
MVGFKRALVCYSLIMQLHCINHMHHLQHSLVH